MLTTKPINRTLKASLAVALSMSAFSVMAEKTFSENVDTKGNISLAKDFRSTMVHLGSWFVPEGGASGFHGVYTEKKSIQAYRKTGKFPDGATLVKELRASSTGDYTTGSGVHYANTELKQWFVMVKDTKNRFAKNKSWGNGWGWALFKPDNMKKNVSTDYKKDCLGCHLPAKGKDWVYTEAYPILMPDK